MRHIAIAIASLLLFQTAIAKTIKTKKFVSKVWVADNGDGTYDVSVGIDFDKLGISNT